MPDAPECNPVVNKERETRMWLEKLWAENYSARKLFSDMTNNCVLKMKFKTLVVWVIPK